MRQKNNEKSFPFVLKGINTELIDQKFGFTLVSNLNIEKMPLNITKIIDLSINKNVSECISFIDEAKKSHKCNISMIDFTSMKEMSNDFNFSCYDCFWCKYPIPENVIAIGCPLKYIPNQAIKRYYSEISKDTYTIKENITVNKFKTLSNYIEEQNEEKEDLNIPNPKKLEISNKNYYLTDGIFCSFNCCMAFVNYQKSGKNSSMYNLSEMLLLKIYSEIHPSIKTPLIDEAPHWRQLKKFGGDMTIEEFRSSFNKMEYKQHGFITDFPTFKSIGVMFEENLKF
jgi:hypothetical protein